MLQDEFWRTLTWVSSDDDKVQRLEAEYVSKGMKPLSEHKKFSPFAAEGLRK